MTSPKSPKSAKFTELMNSIPDLPIGSRFAVDSVSTSAFDFQPVAAGALLELTKVTPPTKAAGADHLLAFSCDGQSSLVSLTAFLEHQASHVTAVHVCTGEGEYDVEARDDDAPMQLSQPGLADALVEMPDYEAFLSAQPGSKELRRILGVAYACDISFGPNYRTHVDPEEFEELKADIDERGVLSPVTIYPNPDFSMDCDSDGVPDSPHRFVLSIGSQRLTVVNALALKTVPIVLLNRAPTDLERRGMQHSENAKRSDPRVIDDAINFAAIKDTLGTDRKVAEYLGETEDTVSRRLGLLRLPESVREMIQTRQLRVRHAEALSGKKAKSLGKDQLCTLADRSCGKKGLTIAALHDAIDAAVGEIKPTLPGTGQDDAAPKPKATKGPKAPVVPNELRSPNKPPVGGPFATLIHDVVSGGRARDDVRLDELHVHGKPAVPNSVLKALKEHTTPIETLGRLAALAAVGPDYHTKVRRLGSGGAAKIAAATEVLDSQLDKERRRLGMAVGESNEGTDQHDTVNQRRAGRANEQKAKSQSKTAAAKAEIKQLRGERDDLAGRHASAEKALLKTQKLLVAAKASSDVQSRLGIEFGPGDIGFDVQIVLSAKDGDEETNPIVLGISPAFESLAAAQNHAQGLCGRLLIGAPVEWT